VLSEEATRGKENADSYDYDPRKPVPTIGWDLFLEPAGARDHRPAEKLVLTNTTASLDRDTEVTGRPQVEIFASSSAVDTDWVVTISDVRTATRSSCARTFSALAIAKGTRSRSSWSRGRSIAS
jgi:predicted acyl esterase